VTRIWAGVDRILRISPEGNRDRADLVAWRVRTSVAMSVALHAILAVAVVRTWPEATSAPPSAPPAFVDDAPVEIELTPLPESARRLDHQRAGAAHRGARRQSTAVNTPLSVLSFDAETTRRPSGVTAHAFTPIDVPNQVAHQRGALARHGVPHTQKASVVHTPQLLVELVRGPAGSPQAPGRSIAERTAHPHDAFDVGRQRLGLRLAVTGVQDHQLHRGACRAEGVLKRCGADPLRSATTPHPRPISSATSTMTTTPTSSISSGDHVDAVVHG
jgi:hypothetical protein